MRIGRLLDRLPRTRHPGQPRHLTQPSRLRQQRRRPSMGPTQAMIRRGGLSAHLVNLEADGAAVPDQPAEGGDVEAPAEAITEIEESLFETSVGEETPTEAAPEPEIAEPVMADTQPRSAVEADPDAVSANEATEAVAATMASPRYEGEGVYVGHEPPEGFTIKGNERSMKYHVPESSGYGRTIAEVWFNSEEAAQQAGFVRAQR